MLCASGERRLSVIGDRMIRGALPLKQFRAAIADARVASEGGWNQRGAD